MTRKLERSPLYGVDCHESMGAPLNDHSREALCYDKTIPFWEKAEDKMQKQEEYARMWETDVWAL